MHIKEQIAKAKVLVEALPYFQEFSGQRFLIKIGGSAMDDPQLVTDLLRDIVFLKAIGVDPVLVHGGGKAISRAMKKKGLAAEFVGGLRVTNSEAISVVEDTLTHVINPQLVAGLEAAGGEGTGIPGHTALKARRLQGKDPDTGNPVNLGYVGEVVDCDLSTIECAISNSIPVISPIARDVETNDTLNINADLAAAAIAPRLGAAKLIYMSDVLGVLRNPSDPDTLVATLDRAGAEAAEQSGMISGGMIPKVHSALGAIDAGVGKVHLIDGRIPHSVLLEIFTQDGIGTEIVGG